MENKIKMMRASSGMTQNQFSDYFHIPKRSIENWESGQRVPPEYVVELIEYKLENERQKIFAKNEKNI